MVRLGCINLHWNGLSAQFVNLAGTVDNIPVPGPSHDLRWYFDVAFFHQHVHRTSQHARPPLLRVLQIQLIDDSQPFLFDSFVNLLVPRGGGSVRTRRIRRRIDRIKHHRAHQVQRLAKVLFRFTGKTDNDIGRNGRVRDALVLGCRRNRKKT